MCHHVLRVTRGSSKRKLYNLPCPYLKAHAGPPCVVATRRLHFGNALCSASCDLGRRERLAQPGLARLHTSNSAMEPHTRTPIDAMHPMDFALF